MNTLATIATIADQSTVADGLRGWLFILAIAAIGAAVTVILALVAQPHNVPVMGDELSQLDTWDRPRCTVAICTNRVEIHLSVGHEWWPFCDEHGTPYLTEELMS